MLPNMITHVENTLKQNLREALAKFTGEQGLDIELPEIEVEVPADKSHGDYATNIALQLAGPCKSSPREIATGIVNFFSSELVERVDIAGPGFINFTLDNKWLYDTLDIIIERGCDYGRINYGNNRRVQIEFVSANPTGPLHVGHSRGAVVGDVLAAIMDTAGYEVSREYYINDAGNQMDILGRSTLIRYKQLLGREVELPNEGYQGEYIKDIAREIKEERGAELLEHSAEDQLKYCQDFAYRKLMALIKNDLEEFGITIDTWFSERDLHDGKIKEAIALLEDKGYIYRKEGALWFKSTSFGDDKDRVVIKSSQEPTYLAADIAYHLDKLERGFDQLINIWGADHHGYISRVKAAIQAFGYSADKLEILIVQLVTLIENDRKVPMSKRAGKFVTMLDVLREVGRDAARYFYIMRSTDSHFDFDLDLAREESTSNPVYYIQYAHARICSIFDNLKQEELGTARNLQLLTAEEELDLIKLLARYPEEIKMAAEAREPHIIASYAHELAGAFHIFYNKCRVISEDRELTAARVYLVKATQQVLQNVLTLLGISIPEEM